MEKNIKYKKPKNALEIKIFILCMIAVPMLSFLLFYVYVNFNSIVMAFQRENQLGKIEYSFYYFKLFIKQFSASGSILSLALKNTFIFFSVSMFFMLPLSAIFSFFLYKKIFMYKYFRVIFFLPSLVSAVILTMLYKYLLLPDGPVISFLQKFINWEYPPIIFADERYAMTAIILYGVWTGFGSNLILFCGAMMRIPEDVIEAGKLDGLGLFKELILIVIPMIWPTFSTLIIFSMVGLFSASGPILLFTPGDTSETAKTITISYWIFRSVYEGGNVNYSSAVGLFFTIIGVPIVFSVKYILEKFSNDVTY